jgi:phosphoribosylaminoimidazole-succinocarboxamide synthase
MPDHIKGKGEALCLMGAYCFEKLEGIGVRTHYRGLVDKNGTLLTFKELETPTNIMEINLVNVYKPETRAAHGKLKYDYGIFTPNLKNYLIPLEIIYRNGLPEGSSVFKRLEQGKVTIKDLGLDHYPKPGERFAKPLFDVSTKLEETDRYVTWEEAKKIAGVTSQEIAAIKTVLSKVNVIISETASHAGLDNEDGKIELAFDNKRRLMVVDVVGTLDECRFTYDGMHVSKEIARQFYKKTDWYRDVEEAKKTAETRSVKDWRTICKSQPPKLDAQLKAIIGEMYMAAANEMIERKMFAVSSLADIVKKYRIYEK